MWIIQMSNGLYVIKGGGMNDFTNNPELATRFYTKEAAIAAKPGHHRDMGGTGFKGRVISLSSVKKTE